MTFKWQDWQPNTAPVPESKRPKDRCAPVPKHLRLARIQERNTDMLERRKEEILKRINRHDEILAKLGRNLRRVLKKYRARSVSTTLGQLVYPVTIQRDEQEEQIIRIMVEFDQTYFGMPSAGWDPLEGKYAVAEGQQRTLALRDRIILGLHPDCDPADWESYPIELQVIDLEVKVDSSGEKYTDYSPLRELFVVENGKKLPVSDFDMFVNEAQGKLTDSPNAPTLPEYEKAGDRYKRLKSKGLTVVDSRDENQMSKAGAFGAARYLRNSQLTNEMVDNIADHHHEYSRHEPCVDILVIPIKRLYDLRDEYYYYDKNDPVKVAEWQTCLKNINATVYKSKRDWDAWEAFSNEVWLARNKKLKIKDKRPQDYNTILLIQCMAKAGYIYPGFDPSILNAYTQPSGYDVMTQAQRDVFV